MTRRDLRGILIQPPYGERYWKDRCLAAEAKLERVTDELDSANEYIAHLQEQRARLQYLELREDGLTGRTYWRSGVGL